jgi:hypothetical protein
MFGGIGCSIRSCTRTSCSALSPSTCASSDPGSRGVKLQPPSSHLGAEHIQHGDDAQRLGQGDAAGNEGDDFGSSRGERGNGREGMEEIRPALAEVRLLITGST